MIFHNWNLKCCSLFYFYTYIFFLFGFCIPKPLFPWSFRCCNALCVHKEETCGWLSLNENLSMTFNTTVWLLGTTYPSVHFFTIQADRGTQKCKVYSWSHSPPIKKFAHWLSGKPTMFQVSVFTFKQVNNIF